VYDASGVKHQAKYSYSTSTSLIPLVAILNENSVASTFQTDYCGNYIYQKSGSGNPILLCILTPEGYISTFGGMISYLGNWNYIYFLKDQLGNTRVNLNSDYLSKNTSKVYYASDQIDYYPFGMERRNLKVNGSCFNSGTNPYLYNGKEIDRMNGLNENDYGARWYDAAVGRWGSVDPLAEKRQWISPYVYCSGNPVNRIDPDGRLDGGPDSGGTAAVDTDTKKTTAQSSTTVNIPKKFENVKRTTQTKAPAKTAGGNIKADCTITAKQTTHITQNSIINVDVSTTDEIQKESNNVEVIQNLDTKEQEAEVTTNYGIKVNVPTHGGPVLSGVGTTSMGTDGKSIVIDFSTKIPWGTGGFGITFSVNPSDISPLIVPAVKAIESEAEPLLEELAPLGL
jgi:RHS repeat-associated protein